MGKKHSARQPSFSRLSSRIAGLAKRWYKKLINRSNRRGVKQARDIEEFRDKPLDPWAID